MIHPEEHVLPSSDFLKNTANLLVGQLREYFLPIFVTLDKLVVDLDELEGKQLDIMENIMMQYTAEGRDPVEHLAPGMEILSALLTEEPFEEDLENIHEKQETVIHIVKTAKLEHTHFLRKCSKLRLETMALQQGSENDGITHAVACICIIDRELYAMYTQYPRVRGLFCKLYLAGAYRATIAGGFKHMYASYVKLEIESLREQTEAGASNERLSRISGDERATKTPALSDQRLRQINKAETTGDAGTAPTGEEETTGDAATGTTDEVGRAEHDGTWQISDSEEQELKDVWNAAAARKFRFDPSQDRATWAWARDNEAVLLEALGSPTAEVLGNEGVAEIMRLLDVDVVADIMEQHLSGEREAEELKGNSCRMIRGKILTPMTTVATGADILMEALLLDNRISERIAARKEASRQTKAHRSQRFTEGYKARQQHVAHTLRGDRGAKHLLDCKQGRVALRAPPNHVGEGSSSGFGRADAIAAPRTHRAPAPARHPLPEVRPIRKANYRPVQPNVGDTGFVLPSDQRTENPNLVLAADYYDPWITQKEQLLAELRSHQAFQATKSLEVQRRIERHVLDLSKIQLKVEHNAKKLNGVIAYDPKWDDATRTCMSVDEVLNNAHAAFNAQRAAAQMAQQAAEIRLLEEEEEEMASRG